MHLIVLEKTINIDECLDDLITVNLEENVQYNKNNSGIQISGYIDIEGDYICKGQKKVFEDKLYLDILAPYDEIIDKDAIQLKITDFDYVNGENKIIFTFKLNVEGWKEVSTTFLSPDVSQKDEKETFIIESNENSKVVDKLKELLAECKKLDIKEDCIETYLKHGLEDVEELIENNNNDNNNDDDDDNDDRNNLIEFNIVGEDKEKEKINLDSGDSSSSECDENYIKEEYPIKFIEEEVEITPLVETIKEEINIVKKDQNSLNNLFKKTSKKVMFCSYRVVYEGETYESIANEEHISVYDLKRFNKNKTLKEGILIKVPLSK